MITSHIPNCEHPGCHEVGTRRNIGPGGMTWAVLYLCEAHADKKETTDER